MTEKTIHQGRNVKRLREILSIKQETLAVELGLSQQTVSALEQKEALDKDMLEKIAKIMKIPVEAIKNFDEEAAVNIISSTLHDTSIANHNHNPVFNFNPVDKYFEAIEENKKLYERLLESEKEKVAILQQILTEKK